MENGIILFGGGKLLIKFASYLKINHQILVITSPRHEKEMIEGNKFIDILTEMNLKVIITKKLSPDVLKLIKAKTLGISFGAPWIFKKDIIDIFNGQLFNNHPTNLPTGRGGAPVSWNIIKGVPKIYSTLHQVTEGIDDGDLVYKHEYEFIETKITPKIYHEKSIIYDFENLKNFIEKIDKGFIFKLIKQNENDSEYLPRLDTSIHGVIDWTISIKKLKRFILAFSDPYIGAWTFLNDDFENKIHIKSVEILSKKKKYHPFQWGLIINIIDKKYDIAVKGGILRVSDLYMENETKIRLGDRLNSPRVYIDKAYSHRATYKP